MRISGERAGKIVALVLAAASGATREEICDHFPAPDRDSVLELIAELEKRRILADADDVPPRETLETPLDIFHWHFARSTRDISSRLQKQRIVILGVNEISRSLATALLDSGIATVTIVDDPLLRNLGLFDGGFHVKRDSWRLVQSPISLENWSFDGSSCLVATSDFGGVEPMSRWNEFCLKQGCHFFPMVLHDLVGYIGPLVVPGETACYECLRAEMEFECGNLGSVPQFVQV